MTLIIMLVWEIALRIFEIRAVVHKFDCSLEPTEVLSKYINVWIPPPRDAELFGLEFCLDIGNFIIF